MNELLQRVANLSPEKRNQILEKLQQQSAGEVESGRKIAQIEPISRDMSLPLSFAQQRLWFLAQLHPGSAAYNFPIAMRVTGRLDVGALERSLNAIVQRHESLRTTFTVVAEQPVQIIAPTLTMRLPVLDLQDLPAPEQHIELERRMKEGARQPFDLTKGPLLWGEVLQLGAEDHVLLLMMHHIITDAWSREILMRELKAIYPIYLQHADPESPHLDDQTFVAFLPLPLLPIQYADFAYWQRQQLQGDVLAKQLAYWKQQLQDRPAMLELPTDHARPAVQTSSGATRSFMLSRLVVAPLTALGRQADSTLFMVLLTAFKILLYRYTQQHNSVVGSVIANRNRSEIEGLIGFFVNTLVIRTDLSGLPTFRESLRRVREVTLEAYAHQDVPFELLVEELRPQRDVSHSPLFQVSFSLHNVPIEPLEMPGVRLTPLEVDRGIALFDLSLAFVDAEGELQGTVEYSTDLFEDSTIARMFGHFQILLESIVANPDRRLYDLALLSRAERQQLLVDWNASQRACPHDQCFPLLFEAQAASAPDAVAVVFLDQHLSYGVLNTRANQLAHELRRLGVGPEVLVGVCMERSLELVIALLGVLKAGGAYVPLDPSYPAERLRLMLEDSGARVLVTTNDERRTTNEDSVPASFVFRPSSFVNLHVIDLFADWPTIASQPTTSPDSGVVPTNLAYVIYTSGSTGTPKGVSVAHANVVRLFAATQAWFQFDARDVWTFFHSAAFDFSVWEIWGALCFGGRLLVVPYWLSRAPDLFYELLCAAQVSVLNQTPSAFYQLIEAQAARDKLPGLALRLVIFGGEALDLSRLRPWFAHHSQQRPRLVNMYGITETTVHVTYRPLTCADLDARGSRIGGALADLQLYVLGQHRELLPIGVPGELYVGGAGLARGYLNRPDLTAERFVPNPFAEMSGIGYRVLGAEPSDTRYPTPDTRLYKTGDLARYLSNGDIEYLGRIDHQVKIRGFRIELGEIEAALQRHVAVRDVVVLAREDAPGDKRLVAYLLPDHEHAFTVQQLLRFKGTNLLADRLLYELPNGMPIVCQNKSEADFVYREIFEDHAYFRHGITLEAGDCVFDVGANIGLFTIFAGHLCPNITVYAFEPIPPVFELLRLNIALYRLDVRLCAYGLARETTSANFIYYPHISILSGRFADYTMERKVVKQFLRNEQHKDANELLDELLVDRVAGESVTCLVKPLSEVIREYQVECIDLLKIDVEKSELDVLAGIDTEDWPKIRQIVVEVHDIDNRLEYITTVLQGHGYELMVEQDTQLAATGIYSIYARRPSRERGRGNDISSRLAAGVGSHWYSSHRLIGDVQQFLQEQLPAYMQPSALVLLERWPLTPSGKLDRRALPAPEPLASTEAATSDTPRTAVEELLAGVWTTLLGVAQVRREDNFFALGGHSLLATRVLARVRELFEVELAVRTFFQAPTLAELASQIELERQSHQHLAAAPLTPQPRGELLPLSFAQQRLWFLHQFEPASSSYHLAYMLQLSGRLDLAALAHTLDMIVARHESLRTSFGLHNGVPTQRIAAPAAMALPVLDLSRLAAQQREPVVEMLSRQVAWQPFDLTSGPLLRVMLLRLRAEEHVLLLTMHHIISDGWSMSVLVREITALYSAYCEGRPAVLPELPIQYADYALWQREWLVDDVLAAQLNYWTEQLREPRGTLELPLAQSRPSVQTFAGAIATLNIDAALTARLQALSRQAGATLFMTLLAGFDVLLYRYSGQDDILIGSPIANRIRPELEPLIGFFVNTLVLRSDLSGNPSGLALLERVREVCLQAYAHQDMPFERIVEEVQPVRDLSRTPLFQVLFVLQNAPVGQLRLPGLTLERVEAVTNTAPFDLLFSLSESSAGMAVACQYNTDLFRPEAITQLLRHYRTLLDGLAAAPDQRLADLQLLSTAERQQLLVEWNDTQGIGGQGSGVSECIHEMFAAQAARTPDAMAIAFDGAKDERRKTKDEDSAFSVQRSAFGVYLTYAELNARANQLAHYLISRGVGPDVLVGICLERSLELVVALLGVLKAGGTYLPLDLAYPPQRIAFMLEDAQVRVVLTATTRDERRKTKDEAFDSSFVLRPSSFVNIRLVDLSKDWEAIARQPTTELDSGVRAANPAYAIYTSGSTGQPKGVLVSHAALVNYTLAAARQFQMRPDDRVLQFAALGFDVLAEELFPAWACGATVVLQQQSLLAPDAAFSRLLEQACISVVELPAAYWHQWLDQLVQAGARPPSTLRLLLLGCEAPSVERLAAWQGFGVPLLYVFGLTETTITSTLYRLPGGRHAGAPAWSLPIGRPLANTQVYLLDAHMQPVPIGVAGELYIGGAGLARGYLNRPDLTAERFVPNPFTKVSGVGYRVSEDAAPDTRYPTPNTRYPTPDTRLYRTGDLARYLPDGNLQFLGRVDQQLNLRGFRIELGEIEAQLAQHPSVGTCAVVVRDEASSAARLVAYVVPTKDEGDKEARRQGDRRSA